jgi:hypothetical protein
VVEALGDGSTGLASHAGIIATNRPTMAANSQAATPLSPTQPTRGCLPTSHAGA